MARGQAALENTARGNAEGVTQLDAESKLRAAAEQQVPPPKKSKKKKKKKKKPKKDQKGNVEWNAMHLTKEEALQKQIEKEAKEKKIQEDVLELGKQMAEESSASGESSCCSVLGSTP